MTDPQEPLDDWVAEALREVQHEEEATQAEAFQVLGVEASETTGNEVSPADVVRMLGGTRREQIAAAGKPGPRSRRRDLERAKEALGVDEPPAGARTAAERAKYYATEWRYFLMSRCHRRQDQARIVGYLEDNLDGTETELPIEITDAVSRIINRSRSQPRESIPGSPALQYIRLKMAYQRALRKRDE